MLTLKCQFVSEILFFDFDGINFIQVLACKVIDDLSLVVSNGGVHIGL
jgi:hypothetical protein